MQRRKVFFCKLGFSDYRGHQIKKVICKVQTTTKITYKKSNMSCIKALNLVGYYEFVNF
jgi:hypothetical protein